MWLKSVEKKASLAAHDVKVFNIKVTSTQQLKPCSNYEFSLHRNCHIL